MNYFSSSRHIIKFCTDNELGWQATRQVYSGGMPIWSKTYFLICGWHFAEDTFKRIFVKDNNSGYGSALVQVRAWIQAGDKP